MSTLNLDEAQALADKRADDRFRSERAPARFLLEAFELGNAREVHRVEAATEYRFDQRVLGAEVIVHGREVHAGFGGEHAHRCALEAMEHEQLLGDVENAGAGFVRRLHGAEGHGKALEDESCIQTNV